MLPCKEQTWRPPSETTDRGTLRRREILRHVSGTALMCKHPIKIRRNIGPPGCSLPTGHPARQWTRATHAGSGGAISATECSEPFLLHCCLATASEAGTLPGHLRLCGQPNMTNIAVRPGRGSPRDSFATARASSRSFTRGRHPRKGGAEMGRLPQEGLHARGQHRLGPRGPRQAAHPDEHGQCAGGQLYERNGGTAAAPVVRLPLCRRPLSCRETVAHDPRLYLGARP